jgi:hypothetical protein
MQKLRGNFFVNSYVKPQFLTHDPARIASYAADPLITRPISVNILLGLYEAAERVVADAQAITVPTQLLISGADWVVPRAAAPLLRAPRHARSRSATSCRASSTTRWASATARRRRKARRFLLERFDAPAAPVAARRRSLRLHARRGRRAAPRCPRSRPRGLYWAATRLGLRLGGLLSEGIALGHAPASIPAARSTTSTATRRAARASSAALIDRSISTPSAGAASASASCTSRKLLARRSSGCARGGEAGARRRHRRRPRPLRAGGAQGSSPRPDAILLRDYSDINVESGRRADQAKRARRHRPLREGRRLRPRLPGRARRRARRWRGVRPVRAVPRQRDGRRSLAGLAAAIRPAASSSTPASPGIRSSN